MCRDTHGLNWLIIDSVSDIERDVREICHDTNGLNWLIVDSMKLFAVDVR